MPEVSGTVESMSKSGKGFKLKEYENWWNFGYDYEGPRPFSPGEGITVTYEEKANAGKPPSFFVMSAWPTTGQRNQPPTQSSGPTPAVPVEPAGPTPAPEAPAPVGPTPTPPDREKTILFQSCLARAQEWVLARYPEGDVNRADGQVLHMVDLYYHEGLKLISGEGDTPPEQPA